MRHMLTRKQMWRRVHGGGRIAGERSSTPTPSTEEPKHLPAALEAPSSSSSDIAEGKGRKVTFDYVVKVVLVPDTKELRPLNAQLWWGADDYVDFRREYVLAIRSAAAAAASKQRDEEQQQPQPPGRSASAGLGAASPELDADESAQARSTKVGADLPLLSPPSSLSLTSLATSLPSANPGAAAAIPERPTATLTVGTSGGHQKQEVPSGRVLSTTGTARSEPNGQALSRPPRLSGRVPLLLSSRSCDVNTTKKWTPSAGMMAAKAAAAAEEDQEGYRTESMSSASDSSLSGGDASEADSDDEPHEEHRGPVFGRQQLRRPAAASRRLPRRLIHA